MNKSFFSEEALMLIMDKVIKRFTRGESSSVTYNQAKQLMGSIIYTLNILKKDSSLIVEHKDLWNLYEEALKRRKDQLEAFKKTYKCFREDFKDYNNLCYKETVLDGLEAFYVWYDIEFNPLDVIITLDYPIIENIDSYVGIELMEAYLDAIMAESNFMNQIRPQLITESLKSWKTDYKQDIFNLPTIICYYTIGCIMLQRVDYNPKFSDSEREQISKAVNYFTKADFRIQASQYLAEACKRYFHIEDISYFTYNIRHISDTIWTYSKEDILNVIF